LIETRIGQWAKMHMGRCFGFANSRVYIAHYTLRLSRIVISGLIFLPAVLTSTWICDDKSLPFRDPHFPSVEKSTYEVNQKGKIHFSIHKISRENYNGQVVYVISTDSQRMFVRADDLRPILIEQRDDDGQQKFSIEYYKHRAERRVRFIYPGPKRNVVKEIREDSYDVNTILEVIRGYPFKKEKVKFILVTSDHVVGVYAKIKAEQRVTTPIGIFDCYFIESGVSGLKGKIIKTKYLFWVEKDHPYRIIKQEDSKGENIITLVKYEVLTDAR